jgi:hypothetical protein
VNVLRTPPALSLYLSLLLLGVATYLGGTYGISAVRLLYLFGCMAVAFQALRFGTAYHFEALIVLFAFSPYLRRIVDYGCGFEVHGYMLTGPLLAALLPTTALPAAVMATRGHLVGRLGPYLLAIVCLGYAAFLPVLNGDYVSALAGFGKSASVLLYGCWLLAKAEDPQQVIRQGARAFAVVTPIVGIYGIMQYFNPSPADSYWMTASAMSSIGLPEPEQVRVFSTMNSPASLGNFLGFGLMLVGFVRSRWNLLMCFGPGSVALLLSQSRTAWLALAASIIYTLFYSTTRLRALIIVVAVASATTFAIIATPLGDVISNRLETISDSPSQDGSAQARLGQLVFIFGHLDNYLLGSGTGGQNGNGLEYSTQSTGAYDGMIVWSITAMGIFVGLIFDISVIWAGLQGLLRLSHRAPPEFVIAAGLVAGQLITIPLVNPTSAEFGIFFWAVVAVAARTPPVFQISGRGSGRLLPNRSVDRTVSA